jgi:hypothetical protein
MCAIAMDLVTAALAIALLKPMRRRMLARVVEEQPGNPALAPAFK